MLLHPSLPGADGPAQTWEPLLISPCPEDQKLRKIQDMGTKLSPVKACHEKREESYESHTRTASVLGQLSGGVHVPGEQPNLWLLHVPVQPRVQGSVGLKSPIETALSEMFNKRLCRQRYFIQRSALSFVTALTLVEEASSLSWWWFICSIKSSDKALVLSMGPEIRLAVKRQEWRFHLSCSDLNAEELLRLLLCYFSSKETEWGAELCHNCLGWNQKIVQAKIFYHGIPKCIWETTD